MVMTIDSSGQKAKQATLKGKTCARVIDGFVPRRFRKMHVVDQLAETFYTTTIFAQREKVTEELKGLTAAENFFQNLEILRETSNQYTIKFCASNLIQAFSVNYTAMKDVMSESCMQILVILEKHCENNLYVV
jgi:hypothetical protein